MGGVSWKGIAGVIVGFVLAALVGGIRADEVDVSDVPAIAAGLAAILALVFLFRAANATGEAAWDDVAAAIGTALVAAILWNPLGWAAPVGAAALVSARWFRRPGGASPGNGGGTG